mgnify:CR=1 FL=1
MSNFTYGNVIDFESKQLELKPRNITDESAIRLEMSRLAMLDINALSGGSTENFENLANMRVNAFKEDFGNGVCTRIMVYNASGSILTFQDSTDSSGHWGNNTLPTEIQVGQWATALHEKSRGSATGSCGAVVFHIDMADEVFIISWDVPWSGDNHACCYTMLREKWNATSWDEAIKWAETEPRTGTDVCGPFTVDYSITNDSSPILRVVIRRHEG